MRQAIKVASLLLVIGFVLGYLGLSVHGIYAETQTPPIQIQAAPPQFKPVPLPTVPYTKPVTPAKPKKAKPAPPTSEDQYRVCPVQDPCRQRMVVFI